MDELRARKRAAFIAISEQLSGLTVAGAPVRIHRSADALRIEADLPDGSRGLMHLATIKQGLPPGAFAIDPRALVYGGLVRGVLDQLPVPGRHIAGLGAIVSASAMGDGRTFAVHRVDDPAIEAVCHCVRHQLAPVLAAFSGQWPAALAHTLQHPQEVDRPYAAATVLSLLAGVSPDAVSAHAVGDERYWDHPLAMATPDWPTRVRLLVAGLTDQPASFTT